MAEPQRREHRNAQTHTHTQIPTDIHAGIGIGRELSNPPQSRAPPRGPAAQGATSYQASRRLQIRSALSPPAGSGDPPPLPSAPAPLRAAAPLREGPGLPPAARRVNLRLPPGRVGPLLPGEPCLRGDPGSRRHSQPGSGAPQPDAAACVRSAGARPVGARPGGRPSRPLILGGLSFPGAEAHSAQTGQGPVPAGYGLLTPSRVPQPPKVAYIPAINPVSFALSNSRPPRPWGHHLLPLPLIVNPARPGIVPTPRHYRFLTPNHLLNSMSPAARPHLSGPPVFPFFIPGALLRSSLTGPPTLCHV